MDRTPDYAEFSVPTSDLDIDVPGLDRLAPIPPITAMDSAGRGAATGTAEEHGPNGREEALVDAGRDLQCLACYDRAGWPGTRRTTWLRTGVVTRLIELSADLPDGIGLAIFDGWRSPETVRALHDHYYSPGSTLEPGYLADPDGRSAGDAPPPHETGGAVDLTLSWRGTPLSLGTPFDEFTPRAHLRALESATEGPDRLDRDLRRLLHTVMTDAGFVAYDQEWWHFSFGDADWAAATGGPVLYGATTPNR